MALLEALQERFETTLVTAAPFDCARLNQAYHCNVDADRIRVRTAPMPAVVRSAKAGDALKGAFFGRFVKSIGHEFDLCISSYNFADFGRPAIQFIADFSWDDDVRRAFDPVSPGLRGLLQRRNLARRAYLAGVDLVRGGHQHPSSHAGDIVVANSRWSARLLAERHGISAKVIYPPVHAPDFDPTVERTSDFVMLGRIAPDKRVTEAIDLMARVRARGHDVRLHVIGPLDASPYGDRVRRRAKEEGGWVRLHGGLYGEEKYAELARHSFGLHMRRREAFGIAVAEMVKMGLVPFVPADSAPAEIVEDERLTFRDPEQAVDLIDRLLRDQILRRQVRNALTFRGRLFSKEEFVRQVNETVGLDAVSGSIVA